MIKISKDVEKALKKNKAVVALESTIITHGMPYPENYETALKVEEIVHKNGAVPATVAIIDGICYVGLSHKQLKDLAQKEGVLKISKRDIGYAIANKKSGGTTVAATMILAAKAGISVFVTGGIGGVHRGAQETFDISADLEELGKTNMAVVCAGAKAILDLGLTLEYLETKGVPVYGYQTEYLPAFYCVKSEFKVDRRVDTPLEFAQIMSAKWGMGIDGGILITNPVPKDAAISNEAVEEYIKIALEEMNTNGIKGKDCTPFLLARIADLSEGRTLQANIALIKNNARLGAEIAVKYAKESKKKSKGDKKNGKG